MKSLIVLFTVSFMGGVVSAQTDSASFYFEKGVKEENARRYREAEKNFAKAVGFEPKNITNLLRLANSLMEQRRYAEAKEKYHAAEILDANNQEVIDRLATLSYNTRKYEDAIRYAQKKESLKIGKGNNLLIARSH